MQRNGLSNTELLAQLDKDLRGAPRLSLNRGTPKPAKVVLAEVGAVYLYLWNMTRSAPGTNRPEGELKMQVKIPGYQVGARQSVAHDDAPALLLGHSKEHQTYCLWDARQRPFPAYSANLQATSRGCELAVIHGLHLEVPGHKRGSVKWRLYTSERMLREVVVAACRYIAASTPSSVPSRIEDLGLVRSMRAVRGSLAADGWWR